MQAESGPPFPNGNARHKLKETNIHTQTVKAAATWKQLYVQVF